MTFSDVPVPAVPATPCCESWKTVTATNWTTTRTRIRLIAGWPGLAARLRLVIASPARQALLRYAPALPPEKRFRT